MQDMHEASLYQGRKEAMHQPNSKLTSALKAIAGLVTCLIAAILIYTPGLHGPFIFDDRANILTNEALHIQSLSIDSLREATFSRQGAIIDRPISMLSFALNHYFSGLNPAAFKITNLLIHLLNGILIFFIVKFLFEQASGSDREPPISHTHIGMLALAVSAAWLLHPLALTSVLYVVQRMASLATLFTLSGILLYVLGRRRMIKGDSGTLYIASSFLICLPLAVLSKENGALLPLYLLIIELTLFRFTAQTPRAKLGLITLFGFSVILPGLAALTYLSMNPEWLLTRYEARNFDLSERLLTQSRAIWFYIGLILVPSNARLGLFQDGFPISRSLLDPITTIVAIFGLASAIFLALFLLRKLPIFAFGILFFLAGHTLESTIFPLELVHEHRNYLPMLGIIMALFFYALHPGLSTRSLPIRRILALALIAAFFTTTLSRAMHWSSHESLAIHEVLNHPESPRANTNIGNIYAAQALAAENQQTPIFYEKAKEYYLRTAELQENFLTGIIELIKLSQQTGFSVEDTWLSELIDRLRNEPYLIATTIDIDGLLSCQKSGNCKLSNTQMNNILRAALDNPTLRGRVRAETLTMASKYYIEQANDQELALVLIAQAAESQPKNPRYRLHLVTLLTILGRYEDAKEELERAIELDRFGAYGTEIEAHTRRLATLTN